MSIARGGEMVDTGDLKSPDIASVPVRVRPRAPPIMWCHRQAVRPQPAKLLSPVQIRVAPPIRWRNFLPGDGRAVEYTGLENRRG